jgi:hypothetical protein
MHRRGYSFEFLDSTRHNHTHVLDGPVPPGYGEETLDVPVSKPSADQLRWIATDDA